MKNPEHGGRQRGFASGVGKKAAFGTTPRGTSSAEPDPRHWVRREEYESLYGKVISQDKQLSTQSQKIDFLMKRFGDLEGSSVGGTTSQRHSIPSVEESHSPGDDPDGEEGLSRLYVEPARFVGRATLYPDRTDFHSVPVPSDQIVVLIRSVADGAGNVPLPFPQEEQELHTVQDAASGKLYVKWLRHLIDIKVYDVTLPHSSIVVIKHFLTFFGGRARRSRPRDLEYGCFFLLLRLARPESKASRWICL